MILTTLLFLYYIYGLGRGTRMIFKEAGAGVVMTCGVGLAVFPLLGIFLNALGLPIDWKIFFALASIGPAVAIVRHRKLPLKFIKPDGRAWILAAVLAAALALYCGGPFFYPWLEDSDSWHHAASVKYVATEKNLNVPKGMFQYIDPYPPGYAVVMGVLHQTSPSLSTTLKVFNSLIIWLGFPFFYLFVKEFSGRRDLALAATFFLFAIPCYLSHFIWAHALAVTLIFPAFYFTLRAGKDRGAGVSAALVVAAILLTQPTQAIKFGVMLMILCAAGFSAGRMKFKPVVSVILISGIVSGALWWGPAALKSFRGQSAVAVVDWERSEGLKQFDMSEPSSRGKLLGDLFDPAGGSATRAYTPGDFLFVSEDNNINNPVGVGMALVVLTLIGLGFILVRIWRENGGAARHFDLTLAGWLIFTFAGVNSMTFRLPVGLFAFRFWMLFAIPAVILAAEALVRMIQELQPGRKRRGALALILTAVLLTSVIPKIKINTSRWPAGAGVYWTSRAEMEGYLWLRKNLPSGTRVFAFIHNHFVLGFDMMSDFWSDNYRTRLGGTFFRPLSDVYPQLVREGYEYLIIGKRERNAFGEEALNAKIVEIERHPAFERVFDHKNDVWIYRISAEKSFSTTVDLPAI